MKKNIAFLILFLSAFYAHAQNGIKSPNTIGWYAYNGDHAIGKKFELHTEYHARRIDFIKTWQQWMIRAGVNYKITDHVKATIGYAYVETFPYGDYPLAKTGYPFPEQRIYEDIKLKHPTGKGDLHNRFRLEQRFVGQLSAGSGTDVKSWSHRNRFRYQLKYDFALKGSTIDAKEPYLSAYDEVFIRFGKNTGKNFFDQNRLFAGVGYKFTKAFKMEAGYIYQLVKHGSKEPLSGLYVFEQNQGFLLHLVYDLKLVK